jgi:hypothetical protein
VRRKEKIERVHKITQILCVPKLGDRVKVLECLIPEHKLLSGVCYSLFTGMAGQERIISKTMMYTFPGIPHHPVQIWLTRRAEGNPPEWWLTRHQFEIIDG